jgi:hypothetical protein
MSCSYLNSICGHDYLSLERGSDDVVRGPWHVTDYARRAEEDRQSGRTFVDGAVLGIALVAAYYFFKGKSGGRS